MIEPPLGQAGLTFRLSSWFEFPWDHQFAIGPNVAVTFTGPKGDVVGDLKNTEAIRGELWL